MKLIQEIDFSGSSNPIDYTNVFTSNYNDYKIIIDNFVADATLNLGLQLINSSGVAQNSYQYTYMIHRSYGAMTQSGSTTNSEIAVGGYCNLINGAQANGAEFTVFHPYDSSSYTSVESSSFGTGEGYDSGAGQGHGVGHTTKGIFMANQSITGVRFTISSGNITELQGGIYGFN